MKNDLRGIASPIGNTGQTPNDKLSWATFWIAGVAVFLVGIDTTLLFAAFRAMRTTFPATSAADLSWVVNAYTVVYAGMLVPAGNFSDSHGRKKVFLLGVAIFVIASAACGLAGTVPLLIGARALQAVGAALLTPASLSIVLAAFPQSRRSVTVSLWGAVGGLAAALGPSLGSFVVDNAGWRWAFLSEPSARCPVAVVRRFAARTGYRA